MQGCKDEDDERDGVMKIRWLRWREEYDNHNSADRGAEDGAPQKKDRARKRCDQAGMTVRFSLTPKINGDMTFWRMRKRGRQNPEQEKPLG